MSFELNSFENGRWIDELFNQARLVSLSAKKVDFYREARRDPPESLMSSLMEKETLLDEMVQVALAKRESLKNDVLGDDRFDEDALREVEFSYQKAICFTKGKRRAHSRMFFLPCVYWSDKNGGAKGVLEYKEHVSKTLAEFLTAFLDERFCDDSTPSPAVCMYAAPLNDWNVRDEEEKMLPSLHEALLRGKRLNLNEAFPARAKAIAESEDSGWSVSVIPFAVEHDDEAWLESISFEGYSDEFIEGFEEIFDPSSQMDYSFPIDPTMIQDEAIRLLWLKQVHLVISEMAAGKSNSETGFIEIAFQWEGKDFAGVVIDFKMAPEHQQDDPSYHRQIGRPSLIDEAPSDLMAFFSEHPLLMRSDFLIAMRHQFS